MIYFDVRPSAHVPTIELRLCDATPRVDDVLLLAGLFRALVLRAGEEEDAGVPHRPVAPSLIRAAMWRAARAGLEGDLVDLRERRPLSGAAGGAPARGRPAPLPGGDRRLGSGAPPRRRSAAGGKQRFPAAGRFPGARGAHRRRRPAAAGNQRRPISNRIPRPLHRRRSPPATSFARVTRASVPIAGRTRHSGRSCGSSRTSRARCSRCVSATVIDTRPSAR